MRKNLSCEEIKEFTDKSRQEKFEAFYAFRPMVENMIRSSNLLDNSYKDLNDYTQEVFCKLWLYIDNFDIRTSSMPVYLSKITTSIIINTYKHLDTNKRKNQNKTMSLSETETINILESLEGVSYEDDTEIKLNNEIVIDGILSELSGKEKDIVIKRFYEEKTMKIIGHELSMSKQRVDQVLKGIFNKLKHNQEAENIITV